MIHQGLVYGHVGAAYDDDAVLAVRVDTNQSDAGGGIVGEYQVVAPNRERIETIAGHRPEHIVSGAADHLRLAAQPSHRRGLIGAFASQRNSVTLPRGRLAWLRQTGTEPANVDVYAAKCRYGPLRRRVGHGAFRESDASPPPSCSGSGGALNLIRAD